MEHEFSFRTRSASLSELSGKECDALVVGGGISGAGVANILAENGINTVLVEKGDFASGTSSGSSKLIHGGLRYLAQGEFWEVRDLLKERNYLIKNTDIVHPLKFHIIVDQYSWKKYTLRFGLFIYNLLSGRPEIPRYRVNDGRYPENVKGYFEYMDAFTDDSRLVIYNIVSAQRKGAICLNYVEAIEFKKSGDSYLVTLKDTVSGKMFELRPKVIVNAAGPWAGKLMEMLGLGLGGAAFRLSKGIHLVVPKSAIPVSEAIAFRSRIDKRQMFVIPRDKVVHIGTTDTFVDSPDDFSITREDTEYIVKSVSALFPDLNSKDIITSFAGLRPLFGAGNDPGKVSRDFEIRVDGPVVNILGGKITNYRSASRKAAKAIAGLLGRSIRTRDLPVVEYRRPEDGDRIRNMIFNECPLTMEDIMRRREAFRIYEPDLGTSMEAGIRDEMKKAGLIQ